MRIDPEMAWEVREALMEFKSTGKHVVIYIDTADFVVYNFAAIADRIVMNPVGALVLRAPAASKFYLSGTLKKIGVAFDELRFFKYKSAAEIFSREKMSDADREQTKEYIDEYYNLLKQQICEARKISAQDFDK